MPQAGAVAAFTVDLLVYPLDTIKTRYQSQQYLHQPAADRQMTRHALRGLYQGIGSVVIATLPAGDIFFIAYENAKEALRSALPSGAPQPVIHALASAGAELASCLVLTPAEVIKQNAQILRQSRSYRGSGSTSLKALRMVRRSEGGPVRRLWAGYTALAARNLPFTAMHFPLFEFVRACIWERKERRNGNASSLIGSGRMQGMHIGVSPEPELVEIGLVTGTSAAVSGALAALATTPTDVVKTRMMLLSGRPEKYSTGNRTSQGMRKETPGGFKVAKAIFREGGIRGLFRGAVLRTAWTALGSGLYLGSYEAAKFWLKGDSPQRENEL
ncbi:mitochondrial carrier domain-containing protein [Lasiosphaeria hispida]|uniref:Mitochondrial carrier domain-containing protein n=1 Tax=Lasiosphaeria hispida TaxID=260671 RepID=A0AAJ0MDV0_9PEZI|nr:mitochondrial carrier domain-containing protein [Lasiosphaeria hispida]